MSATHLVALGNAEAVRWVLRNQRMAFSEAGRRTASRLARGDTLLFYAGAKCWPALGGDSRPSDGVLIGGAVILSELTRFRAPVQVGGRRFEYGCEVFFERLAPLGTGVSINANREELALTASLVNYGQALRRTPVLLSTADSALLNDLLSAVTVPYEDSIKAYFSNGREMGSDPASK